MDAEQLLAWAAVLTALGGIFATLWNVMSTRKERATAEHDATTRANKECHDNLLKAQREAEEFSEKLHQMILESYE